MLKHGIVGSEAAKFTPETEAKAKQCIRELLDVSDCVISGGCHLGGIDIWAEEIGREMGLSVIVFKPRFLGWEAYKERNIKIADSSDIVTCITVEKYPPNYKGMRFSYCYHCNTVKHVKSGGCWTVKYAAKRGKPTAVVVI